MKHIVNSGLKLYEVSQVLNHLELFKASKTLAKVVLNRDGTYDVHWMEQEDNIAEQMFNVGTSI